MAALKAIFKDALLVVKEGRNARITNAEHDFFEADYESLERMIADAQILNYKGYTTKLNRNWVSMIVTV